MQNTPQAGLRHPLLWLSGLVLALHLWLLAQPLPAPSAPLAPSPSASETGRPTGAMRTRTIASAAAPATPPQTASHTAPRKATPSTSRHAAPAHPRPAATASRQHPKAPQGEAQDAPAAPPASPMADTATAPPISPATSSATATAAADTPTSAPAAATAAPEPSTDSAPAEAASPTPPTGVRVALPTASRLKYDVAGTVRGLNYSARGELLWQPGGPEQEYEARLEIGIFLLGSRVQTSRGRITTQGLAPRRFSDKARSEVAAHFERDKGKIIFSANTPPIDLQPDAQDQLSVFIQLAGLLAGQPERYAPGSRLDLQAVGARDAPVWQFVVDGPEQLQLPGGTLATLKLTRPPTHGYDVQAELWLAPQLGYLPARIRLTQSNGDFVDQQWTGTEAP